MAYTETTTTSYGSRLKNSPDFITFLRHHIAQIENQ